MAAIITRRKWMRQPEWLTYVDLGHCLGAQFATPNACFYVFSPAYADGSYSSSNFYDAAGVARKALSIGTAPTLATNQLGFGALGAGGGFNSSSAAGTATTQGTIYWAQQPTRAYNSGVQEFMWGSNGGGTTEFSAQHYSNNSIYVGWNGFSGDNRAVVAASASFWTAGRPDHWAFVWQAGTKATLWANGLLIATAASNTTVGNTTDSAIGILGAKSTTVTPAFSGQMLYWARSDLAADQGQIEAIARNPYTAFSRTRRLYFGAAGGGNVGSAVGSSVVTGVEGYVARALGASVANGVPLTGSVGSAAGHSTAAGVAGSVAHAVGASVVSGVSQTGSIGSAVGHSNVSGLRGSIAKATGQSTGKGVRGSIGRAVGSSVASGAALTSNQGVGTAIGRSVASATGIVPPMGVGAAVGRSVASAIALYNVIDPQLQALTVPRSLVTAGDVTPAMRQWMTSVVASLSSVEQVMQSLLGNFDVRYLAAGTPLLHSPLTTKGDLWGFGSGDMRVPVGSDGQYLVADSTQGSGLHWETLAMPTTGTWRLFSPAAGTSGNWTVPSDVDTAFVTMIGGGGAGYGPSSSGDGGGGGAGEYCFRFPLFVTPSGTVAYAVGAAGAGAIGAGANGGATTFGALRAAGGNGASSSSGASGGGRLAASGGAGAGAAAVSEGAFFWAGAAGGAQSTAGGPCEEFVGNPTHLGGGSGASSPFGQGGAGAVATGAQGGDATAPGSGGGGAVKVGTAFRGGNGGPGALYVEYFSAT